MVTRWLWLHRTERPRIRGKTTCFAIPLRIPDATARSGTLRRRPASRSLRIDDLPLATVTPATKVGGSNGRQAGPRRPVLRPGLRAVPVPSPKPMGFVRYSSKITNKSRKYLF